ncbi:glycosyltransferase family 2 protein [Candidatus Sumerlaeota bacterium]|nr:glycosyltransferase family 2 protein [Candidatus Sumerlaeota bacterium]
MPPFKTSALAASRRSIAHWRAMQSPDPAISIIVPNWEGEHFLPKCLSSLQISANESGRSWELIVVDDASNDSSAKLVRERFPAVQLIRNKRNQGFARAINRGVKAARGAVIVLANNDLVADQKFIREVTRLFFSTGEDLPRGLLGDRLFGVSARTVRWYDGKPNQLCMGAVWRGGRITPAYSSPSKLASCLFVQAGAAAYDAQMFRELGGLSRLYEPGYWEDYDISWRAAKRGWFSIYAPDALAIHHGGGSMTKRYGEKRVEAMKVRNHLIFEMANVTSPRLFAEWIMRVPLSAMRDLRYARGMLDAVKSLPRIARARMTSPTLFTDEMLLEHYRDFTPSY